MDHEAITAHLSTKHDAWRPWFDTAILNACKPRQERPLLAHRYDRIAYHDQVSNRDRRRSPRFGIGHSRRDAETLSIPDLLVDGEVFRVVFYQHDFTHRIVIRPVLDRALLYRGVDA